MVLSSSNIASPEGRRVSISYIDKVAQTWAEEHIDTPEKAQDKLDAHKAAASGVQRVLKQLGLRPRPTQDEYALFLKWTNEWGSRWTPYSPPAPTPQRARASMKYLDRILERLKNQNCHLAHHHRGRAQAGFGQSHKS